jgi:hypothetical protein
MSLSSKKVTEESKKLDRLLLDKGAKAVECSCGRLVEYCPANIKSVICSHCVQKLIAPPDNIGTKTMPTEKRQRGWHLKENYVSPSGKKYRYGVEIDENIEENQTILSESNKDTLSQSDNSSDISDPPIKRKRGRPRKVSHS